MNMIVGGNPCMLLSLLSVQVNYLYMYMYTEAQGSVLFRGPCPECSKGHYIGPEGF